MTATFLSRALRAFCGLALNWFGPQVYKTWRDVKWLFLNRKGNAEVSYSAGQQKFQRKNAICLPAIWLVLYATPRGSQNDLSTFDLRFRNVPWRGEKTASCSAEIVRDEHISKSFRYVSYPCQEFDRRIIADHHVVMRYIQKLLDSTLQKKNWNYVAQE